MHIDLRLTVDEFETLQQEGKVPDSVKEKLDAIAKRLDFTEMTAREAAYIRDANYPPPREDGPAF